MVNHFLKKYKNEMPKIITTVPSSVMEALINYDWQGNVRQLENVIYRAMVAARTETIEIENLPEEIQNHCFHSPERFYYCGQPYKSVPTSEKHPVFQLPK